MLYEDELLRNLAFGIGVLVLMKQKKTSDSNLEMAIEKLDSIVESLCRR